MVAPQHAHAPRPPRSASPGWGRPGAGGSGGGESRSDVSVAAEGGAVLGVGEAGYSRLWLLRVYQGRE